MAWYDILAAIAVAILAIFHLVLALAWVAERMPTHSGASCVLAWMLAVPVGISVSVAFAVLELVALVLMFAIVLSLAGGDVNVAVMEWLGH